MAKTDDDHAYDIPRLNVWFAVCSVLLAVGVVWLVLDDYSRDWKRVQREFNRMEYERARQEIEASLSEEQKQKLEELQEAMRQAEARLQENREAHEAALAELRPLEAAHYRVDQEYKFAKSVLDSQRYAYEEKLAEADDAGALDKERAALEERERQVEELHQEALRVEKRRQEAAARVRSFTEEGARLEKEMAALVADRSRIERKLARLEPSFFNDYFRNLPILDFLSPSIQVQQVVLDRMQTDINFARIPRVDRCTTCHLAIDRSGYEEAPQPYRSHPRLELYLGANSPHPLDGFGCTVCHLGRDRATSFVGAAHTPSTPEQRVEWEEKHGWKPMEHWDQPMLARSQVTASCYKCHSQQAEVRQADALRRGITLIEDLGCHGCHKIQGFEGLRKAGPDLARVASKVDRDWAFRWIRAPRDFRASTKMPHFFGLSNNSSPDDLARTDIEIHAMLEYLYRRSQPYEPLRGPARGDPRRGREIVEAVGCVGCHQVEGASAPTPASWGRRTFGPELSGLGSKTSYAWLYSWVKDPKHYWPGTRMPNLRLSDAEAADVAAYLSSLRSPEFDRRPVPALDTRLLDSLVMDYLTLKQPREQAQAELERMSLDDRQMYLGQKMIQRYGCFGCHNIPGFESALGIGTELSEWGSKLVARLDFGFVHIEHSRAVWLAQKLAEPRIFDKNRIKKPDEKLKMPHFGLSEGQINDVATAVLGFTRERPPLESTRRLDAREQAVEAGWRLIKERNCLGCHALEGEGGEIVEWIAQREGRSIEEARAFSAPTLQGEGKKVQSDWLFAFLKQPTPIRPWLKLRMPTFDFDDASATTLTSYFAAAEREPFPYETLPDRRLSPQELVVARRLAGSEYLNCLSCHQQGARKPQGPPEGWAPDLALAHRRLKPDWVADWLVDPQKLMPGTRMPTYFADEYSGPDDILGGDEKKQVQLLTDYVMSLGRPAAGTAASRAGR
jgi:cbb3-type cytochrome oxidase cytochrome c subunit